MHNPSLLRSSSLALLLLLMMVPSPLSLQAHDGPEETIEHLTGHIERDGPSPGTLYQRAAEYRALGQLLPAAADLEEALKLHANYVPAIIALSEVHLAMNKPGDALRMIDRALGLDVREAELGACHALRAQILHAMGRDEEALRACGTAFDEASPDPDRYLLRSEIHASLGDHGARVSGLKEGFEKTGSGVLEEEWIEAMLDAGQFSKALGPIEAHLDRSRWRSSWLLRRGRALLGQGKLEPARKDLREALEEINQRFNPGQPDLFLLTDRGLSHALLGNREAAANDLALAKATGAQHWITRRLENALK